MKKSVLMVILLYLALPLGAQAKSFEFSFSRSAEFYSDTLIYGDVIGLHTVMGGVFSGLNDSFLSSLLCGVSAFYSQGYEAGVELSHAGGGLDLGYAFQIGDSFRLIPLIFFGASKGKSETDSMVTIDSWGYSFMPGILADYALTRDFLLGFRAGYQMYGYSAKAEGVSGTIKGFLLSVRLAYRLF